VARAAASRLRERVPATALFPHAAAEGPVPVRHVVLLVSGDRPGFAVERGDLPALVGRMLACHAVERRMPLDAGPLMRFAGWGGTAGEERVLAQRESESLARALVGCQAWRVTVGRGSDPSMIWRRLASRGG
jgi:hypothetical protein